MASTVPINIDQYSLSSYIIKMSWLKKLFTSFNSLTTFSLSFSFVARLVYKTVKIFTVTAFFA